MYYGTDMNALTFGVKRSRWNNICWNHHCTGGGIQYSTSRVDFLVCSLNYFHRVILNIVVIQMFASVAVLY